MTIMGAFLAGCSDKTAHEDRSTPLVLMPDQGKMHCNVVRLSGEKKEIFALTLPETIGSKEGVLLNFPGIDIKWDGPDESGIVSTQWMSSGLVLYDLTLTPGFDYVDARMTIHNLTDSAWNDVWSFNCLNPTRAFSYKDSTLERTYMSTKHGPVALANTTRVNGLRPTLAVYAHEKTDEPDAYPFIRDFQALSPDRTNGNFLITLSDSGDSYMAATSPGSIFLFNNVKFTCIHSIPDFGSIGPGEESAVTCRFYFARGNLDSFLTRYGAEVLRK